MPWNALAKTAVPLGLLVLAGCAAPAAYAPRLNGQQTGYTDQQIDHNRYRVTFTGNSATPREMVEDDLLRRAAEVTLTAGSGHFLFDTRDTHAQTRVTAFADPQPYWGRGWRFHPRWGYGLGSPDVDIVTTTRYQAYAEIVVLTDSQAAHEPRAVDAHEVLAHLTPPTPQNAGSQNPV